MEIYTDIFLMAKKIKRKAKTIFFAKVSNVFPSFGEPVPIISEG
jgi:hypothetical protein